jgi:phage-related protein
MERLLADAQAISGVEYNIDSYADVVEAIHVMQTSMDITGTTAREAEHTISGSINSMQAALQNLVVGFGNADADMEQLCNNVVGVQGCGKERHARSFRTSYRRCLPQRARCLKRWRSFCPRFFRRSRIFSHRC